MSDDFDSMRPLKGIGNSYFRSLFEEEKKVMTYSKQLAIGRVVKGTKITSQVYRLDCSEAFRAVVLGPTRSGKTWLLRVICDRWRSMGLDAIFATDIKDEFKSSREPLQQKFRHLLLEGEIPVPTKVVTLRPSFFQQTDFDGLPKLNHYYSINLGNMTKSDFLTLTNAESMTPIQQNVMELIYDGLSKEARETGSFSFDSVEDIIDSVNELNASQKMNLKFKFRPLKASSFYVKEHDKDIVSLIKQGFVPSINVQGFEKFSKSAFDYPSTFVSSVLRTVIEARRKKQIKEILIVVDESPRFMPIDRNPSTKQLLLESVDVDTRFGIDYIFASQSIEKVPEVVVKQSRYLFIPSNADLGTIRQCLMMTGLVRNIQASVNDGIYVKQQLSRTKHSWLVIDKTAMTKTIIVPLAPLSNHMETSD